MDEFLPTNDIFRMHNELYNRGVANTSSLHDIWDFSVIREVLFVVRVLHDLRASDIPPFQTSWLSQHRDVVWKLFGHVDISDELDADRIGEVARSPETLA